jgi:signal transduction histidine kinase
MRLSNFILENSGSILNQWKELAEKTAWSSDMDSDELFDRAGKMLTAVAADLVTVHTSDKSHGTARGQHDEASAEMHAITRLMEGSTLNQIVSGYRVLRMSVLMIWLQQIKSGMDFEVEDMMHFNKSVDQALHQSIASYSHGVEQARAHSLGTLKHDLRTHLGAILLNADVLLHLKDIGAESTKVVTSIYTSVTRADEVVGNLLDTPHLKGSEIVFNS